MVAVHNLKCFFYIAAVSLLSVSLMVQAETFTSRMDQSSWKVDASVFECRMAHDIPFFGSAVFARRAGERPGFYLRAKGERFAAGRASVQAVSPVWRQKKEVESLGKVAVRRSELSVSLGWKETERILAQLQRGREIELIRDAWYTDSDPIRVKISNINFRGAYDKYLDCLGSLLPVNYDQVERTTLYFSPGALEELSSAAKKKLEKIITYARADKDVVAFYIDGHSDSRGARAENLALSKERADLVKSYLANRGIPVEQIAVRWHGERYPVSSNRTSKGRALNRRVTVRLDKTPLPVMEAEVSVPPMVASPTAINSI